MQSVEQSPRIRIAMFFIQTLCYEYSQRRGQVHPTTVEETVGFIEGMMKLRKKGRDDPILERLTIYLNSIKFTTSALDKLKAGNQITEHAFWDLVLLTQTVALGKNMLEYVHSEGLIAQYNVTKLNLAIESELKTYRIAAKFPSQTLIDKGAVMLHTLSNYDLVGIPSPVAEMYLTTGLVELEEQLRTTRAGLSGTVDVIPQGN